MTKRPSQSIRLLRHHVVGSSSRELALHPDIETWCQESGLAWEFLVLESEDDPTHWGPGYGGDPGRAVLPLKGFIPFIRFERTTDLIAFKMRWL